MIDGIRLMIQIYNFFLRLLEITLLSFFFLFLCIDEGKLIDKLL